MLQRIILLLAAGSVVSGWSPRSSFADGVDYKCIMDSESHYIASLVAASGAIILGDSLIYTFEGAPHYQINPYAANFAARALLENPTPSSLAIVKNWMIWVFHHLNPDGSIYDWYVSVDSLNGGTELPSIDAHAGEDIKDYDSKDSYAATFLTLARRYVEVVPADTSWLRGYSTQLESIGNALYSVVDDSVHQFSSDNNDGLTVAKTDWQIKYTMDNSEVNEGLRDMVWLEQTIITYHHVSYFENISNSNSNGFSNLWDSTASMFYVGEGSEPPDWNIFYPDASCQLYPIWAGVISPSSSRASNLYNTFNLHYPGWQNGNYHGELWAIVCYAAAIMKDSLRTNLYLSYVQNLVEGGKNPPKWDNIAAAFTLRAANRMRLLM